MDHKAALAAIPPAEAAAMAQRSDRAGLLHLASHLGLIALTGSYIALGLPFWGALLPLHGIFLVFLFTLEHEATHKTPFATPWLNEAAGRVAGLLLILPFEWFRYFHLAHHRHTNDPELAGLPKPGNRAQFALMVTGLFYWRSVIATLTRNAFGDPSAPYIPPRAHARLRREARIMLTLYAAVATSLFFSTAALWLWLVPILLGQPALRLYLLAEHGRCPPVANMLENTRTTYTTRAIRFLAWNMPYHAEHHAAPNVPFHQLPRLNGYLSPHLRQTSDGYTAFTRDYARSL